MRRDADRLAEAEAEAISTHAPRVRRDSDDRQELERIFISTHAPRVRRDRRMEDTF